MGQSPGMVVASLYTFHADGTYTRQSRSAISLGAAGGSTRQGGQSGGSWRIEQRTLRLLPDNGQPIVYTITDLSSDGMITKLPNGSRRLWDKIR